METFLITRTHALNPISALQLRTFYTEENSVSCLLVLFFLGEKDKISGISLPFDSLG
jgi:hypothetical protein